MNKNTLRRFVLIILLFLLYFQFTIKAGEIIQGSPPIHHYQDGYRYNIQGWTYIHLEGEPYDRGFQYGYLASAEIVNMFKRWANVGQVLDFMRNPPKDYDKRSEAWWNTCKSKSMKYFEKHVPDEFILEMKGMTDGLNERGSEIFGRKFEYEDVLASQFIQDVYYAWYYDYSYRKFHPIRTLIYSIRDLFTSGKDFSHLGHCNAFIATGDATENGEIVVAHATQFTQAIAERVNFIVDIKPTSGYRFLMAAPPGSLWSQEDFYQNEKGIVLTETELVPQGPFNVRKIPKGIRSRKAIQYSSNIDEVISILQKGNNGLIPNEWLIGDTKTGEIARLEQAFFHTPITRKSNGYFFSCKVPHNKKVERELWGFRTRKILERYKIPTKYDNPVIEKFDELAIKYNGKINAENAMDIMTTCPISKATDCKITSTRLLEDMGMYLHFGMCDGSEFNPIDEKFKNFKEITVLPPSGWVKIYDSEFKQTDYKVNDIIDEKSKLFWKFEQKNQFNMNYSSAVISDNTLFAVDSSKNIYSLNLENGKTYWKEKIEEKAAGIESYKNFLLIGENKGLTAIDNNNGKVKWEKNLGKVISKPVLYKDTVIASFINGKVSGFEIETGKNIWSYSFDDKPYISEVKENLIFICADKNCYGFDLEKQKIKWEAKTDKKVTASPKIDHKTVYFGSWDGNLYAVDLLTGEQKWKFQTGWGIDSTPEISAGLVYIGGLDNNFYAINKENGDLEWFFTCNSAIHSNPLAYGEYVFFGCDDGRLYSLDKKTGDIVWSFAPGYSLDRNTVNNYIVTPILSSPVAEDGIIYMSAKGNIYALDAQTIEETKTDSDKMDNGVMLLILVFLFLLGIAIIIRTYLKIKE